MPRISVVMSVYNGEKYLRQAIESILQQTYTDFEFIIIDDGSTDSSREIIQSYDDKRIRLVINEQNIGLTKSLNKGIRLAKGEFIARMDADDISLPQRFEKQVAYLDSHPEVGVLGTYANIIDHRGKIINNIIFPTEHETILWTSCFFINPIIHPSVMFRKDFACKVGGYDDQMITSQDYHLWAKLSTMTRLANLNSVELYLRKHEENVSSYNKKIQFQNSIIISSWLLSIYLNKELKIEIIKNYAEFIWYKKRMNSDVKYYITNLIYCLCMKFKDIHNNNKNIKFILKDAYNKIIEIKPMIGLSFQKQIKIYYRLFYINYLLLVWH